MVTDLAQPYMRACVRAYVNHEWLWKRDAVTLADFLNGAYTPVKDGDQEFIFLLTRSLVLEREKKEILVVPPVFLY